MSVRAYEMAQEVLYAPGGDNELGWYLELVGVDTPWSECGTSAGALTRRGIWTSHAVVLRITAPPGWPRQLAGEHDWYELGDATHLGFGFRVSEPGDGTCCTVSYDNSDTSWRWPASLCLSELSAERVAGVLRFTSGASFYIRFAVLAGDPAATDALHCLRTSAVGFPMGADPWAQATWR